MYISCIEMVHSFGMGYGQKYSDICGFPLGKWEKMFNNSSISVVDVMRAMGWGSTHFFTHLSLRFFKEFKGYIISTAVAFNFDANLLLFGNEANTCLNAWPTTTQEILCTMDRNEFILP